MPRRHERPRRRRTLTEILVRSLGLLLVASAVINLFYHSRLPDPTVRGVATPRSNQTAVIDVNETNIRKQPAKSRPAPKNSSISTSRAVLEAERRPLLDLLADAGVVEIDDESLAKLPKWSSITDLYGVNGPLIYGLDTCERFRSTIGPAEASMGVAGLFNTGTNPMNMYLEANCRMPNNTKEAHGGMRFQVPWGKHMLADYRWNNTARHDAKVNKTAVLPVVVIRDPFTWMQSMCRHPYAAQWRHHPACPRLVQEDDGQTVNVTVHYPEPFVSSWPTLVDLWSDWYRQYLRADYPRLITRFEDLIFHQKELIRTICDCAGGVPKSDNFTYIVDEAKWGAAHKGSSNMISAMVQYGNAEQRLEALTAKDIEYAMEHVNRQLMDLFQYRMPSVADIKGS